ncbi:hypothetical protein RFF05_12280 [Bengtsoniella intestinalis]
MHSHNRKDISHLYFHKELLFFGKNLQTKEEVLTFLSLFDDFSQQK